jgi:hypothetical protein
MTGGAFELYETTLKGGKVEMVKVCDEGMLSNELS